ncbi:PREDICTED: tripartite motif-containing protein 77-like, partial [Galeopterus variegatus]|uniref:Tripartite motif-containing protein 77-like n=1 Tax=Galeopterus variegatus TaxID=482537 RepID=A0ABM0Q2Z4_GALVR
QKLLKQMRSVWEKTQKNQRNLNRETSIIQTWMMIHAEYWKVCQLLYGEEQHYLERLEKERKEIFQQLMETFWNHVEKLHLSKGLKLNHFEKMGVMLETIKHHAKDQVHYSPELLCLKLAGRWRHLKFTASTRCVSELNLTERQWKNPLTVPTVYVSWEDEIAACHVPLFEDLRHLLSTPALLDVVHNPTRSKCFLAWGAQPFTSGRHYWEVDVGGCGNWVTGFCNDSWTKRNDMLVNSEGIFLLFCVKEENCCRLFTSSPLLPHYVERPLGPVGVFLDYECGTLSFVNAAHSSLICSLFSCSFSSLQPFFCTGTT